MGAADARRKRSRARLIRNSGSTISAGCMPTPPRSVPAASSPTTRRSAAASSKRLARRRAIRLERWSPGCRSMGMHVVARTDPHAVRDEVRAAHPDWIARDADGRAATPLGEPGAVGDVRARPLQLRFHGPGASRDRRRSTRSMASSRTAGRRRGRLLLRQLPEEFQGCDRAGPAALDRSPRSGAAGVSSHGAKRGSPNSGRNGMPPCARRIPRRASFPTAPRI